MPATLCPSSPPQRSKRMRDDELTENSLTPQKKAKTIDAIRSFLLDHHGISLEPFNGTDGPFDTLKQTVDETTSPARKSALVNDINWCFTIAEKGGISYKQLANEHDKTFYSRR